MKEETIKQHSEIESLEKMVKGYKTTILELENKISLLIKENERISVAYEQRMKEIDVLKYRGQNLERVRAQELEQMRTELEKKNSEHFVKNFSFLKKKLKILFAFIQGIKNPGH